MTDSSNRVTPVDEVEKVVVCYLVDGCICDSRKKCFQQHY